MTSIIIVTYQSKRTISKLLSSIEKHFTKKDCEIIVVDNNSTDGTIEVIKKFPFAKAIFHKKNTGFAYACHSGANQAKGQYLLFLNPDVVVKSDIISTVIPMFKDKTIGVIGGKIENPDGSIQRSVRGFPTVSSHIFITLKVHHLSENFFTMKGYFLNSFDYSKESNVDQVMGAFFFTTRKLWDDIGGFDKRFFIWFEEVDYCFQVKKLGYRVVYTPTATVEHIAGASFSQIPKIRKQFWFLRSMIQYFIKNGI